MSINGHAALVRGCPTRPAQGDVTQKPAEIRRLTNPGRSPSVRPIAEQRANMRDFVRRDCGRIDRQSAGSLPHVCSQGVM